MKLPFVAVTEATCLSTIWLADYPDEAMFIVSCAFVNLPLRRHNTAVSQRRVQSPGWDFPDITVSCPHRTDRGDPAIAMLPTRSPVNVEKAHGGSFPGGPRGRTRGLAVPSPRCTRRFTFARATGSRRLMGPPRRPPPGGPEQDYFSGHTAAIAELARPWSVSGRNSRRYQPIYATVCGPKSSLAGPAGLNVRLLLAAVVSARSRRQASAGSRTQRFPSICCAATAGCCRAARAGRVPGRWRRGSPDGSCPAR